MENLSDTGLALWNGTSDIVQYWVLKALNTSWVVGALLIILGVLAIRPYVWPKLRNFGLTMRTRFSTPWTLFRVRRARKMGLINSYILRLRIADYLVEQIDKDYLAGLDKANWRDGETGHPKIINEHITHKQRQRLYRDLGKCLGLEDLIPIPRKKSLHPALMEKKKKEAKVRLGLDPNKPLREPSNVTPINGRRRRRMVADPPVAETVGMKVG